MHNPGINGAAVIAATEEALKAVQEAGEGSWPWAYEVGTTVKVVLPAA